MKILLLSKACVVGAYQKKLELLAHFAGVDLRAVVPSYWQEPGGRRLTLERMHTRGYSLLLAPMALNGHFHIHFYPGLGGLVRRVKPDILHIEEEPYNLATFQAMRLGMTMGAKRVFFTWQNLFRRYPPPFDWVESYNLKHAHRAIAGNHEGVQVLRAKGFSKPVDVLPQFGVDQDVYRPREDFKPPLPFIIGYVGRLVEEKGIDLLLQAAAGLVGVLRVRILGSGPFLPQLQTLVVRLGLQEKVTFDPARPSAEMPGYYHNLDALVLPSRTRKNWKEQFGRVLIEAMASGVPVVGSSSGEIPHVIGEAGLLFPEGNFQVLRQILQGLMDDRDLWQSLAAAGRKRVLAHFTQKRVAEETYRIWQELLANV